LALKNQVLLHGRFANGNYYSPKQFYYFFTYLLFVVRAYTLSHSISPFLMMDFIMVMSHKVFAWAGFKLLSSRSLPLE
jgi:hypothetical protein